MQVYELKRIVEDNFEEEFQKRKLQHQFKKISFSSISSLILKSNFKLEVTYNGRKTVIYIGNVKNIKRLVLILKKEFGEKLVI